MQQKSTISLSSIQMNGVLHDTAFSGKATAEAFKAYLENDLLHKFKTKTMKALPCAIQCAFQAATPTACVGWF